VNRRVCLRPHACDAAAVAAVWRAVQAAHQATQKELAAATGLTIGNVAVALTRLRDAGRIDWRHGKAHTRRVIGG
jgi:DNA-binding MarR family transcriptional regulator